MSESADIVITVEKREPGSSGASGRLRREGKVPAVVYGGGKDPVTITVDEVSVQELLKQEGGENTIFLLKLKGTKEERQAIIKELQTDPINGKFVHIDFLRVMRGQKLTVKMPVELIGDSVGVRHGGRVDFVSRELEVEVLPREMFDKLVIDISDLDIGDHVMVSELEPQLPPSAKFLEDTHRTVVVISAPKAVALEEEEEEAELVVGEAEEPEVIRGRHDEEQEEEEG
jgi:large subunit ribosomal protein L25